MYSFKELFKQEPAAIKTAIYAIGAALITSGVLTMSVMTLAAIIAPTEIVLNLFYVRPLTVTKDALQKVQDAIVAGPVAPPPASVVEPQPASYQPVEPPQAP